MNYARLSLSGLLSNFTTEPQRAQRFLLIFSVFSVLCSEKISVRSKVLAAPASTFDLLPPGKQNRRQARSAR